MSRSFVTRRSLWTFCVIFLLSIEASFSIKNKVSGLKDMISNQSSDIHKLAAQINDIDSRISTNNNNYLSKIKEIEKLENKIEKVKKTFLVSSKKIAKEQGSTKLAFNHYLLESFDVNSENDDYLLSRKVYKEVLEKRLLTLQQSQKRSNELLKTLSKYELVLQEKKSDEKMIYGIILDLENHKRSIGKTYLSLVEVKNINQNKLDVLVAKTKAEKKVYKSKYTKKVTFLVGLPLESFVKAKVSKEGISFKYTETLPIKAPRSGKVVYAGELASYGKVLILDHGQDVRSVLLGEIAVKVAKGDLVKSNQIIGYTVSDQGIEKTLYYEIRKKNIVQNTSRWVAKSQKKYLKI